MAQLLLQTENQQAIHNENVTYFHNYNDFLSVRRNGIGGSDIGAITGESSYRTPLDIYKSKKGIGERFEGNETTYWGNVMEDVILNEFIKRHADENLIAYKPDYTLRHKSKIALVNLDGIITNGDAVWYDGAKFHNVTALIEIKTASEYMADKWTASHIPFEYYCQVQWAMGLTSVDKTYVVVLIGGNKYKEYCIEANSDFFDNLMQKAQDFWFNHIILNIPPAPSNLTELQEAYPESNGQTLALTTENEDAAIISEFLFLKAEESKLSQLLDKSELAVKTLFADYEAISLDGKVVLTYKNSSSQRFDSKKFQAENPDLASKYIKTSSSRTLRRKAEKASKDKN